jgi:hypothetical protein
MGERDKKDKNNIVKEEIKWNMDQIRRDCQQKLKRLVYRM